MPATNIHSILKHLTNPSLATCLLWFFSFANSAGSCKCGREGAVRQRIVGGEDSVVGSHIFVHRTPFCRVLILHLIHQSGKYPWIVAINFFSTDGSRPGG